MPSHFYLIAKSNYSLYLTPSKRLYRITLEMKLVIVLGLEGISKDLKVGD